MQTWHGMSDSLASETESPPKCEECRAATRLGNGLCLSCTLREGLDADREASSENFESVLLEAEVRDKEWRLGNYEILEEIGRGGMGVIYRARQRHSRRIVAVKCVLNYHADSRETLKRFRREAEAAASLDHPNILPIYEVSQDVDGLPFFSMKFAPGGSLAAAAPALRSEPRVSIELIAKVARAVQFAHEQGILHRDLKPGNVMLDGRGEPLVSDFGLAKWLDTKTDLTRSLTIFGTPGYIAPEQAEGHAADLTPAADVYSLGAILFDLLAGRPPFIGGNALAVIHQASGMPAPKLRSLVKDADRDLETICARCLEREATARYQSAADLAEDLKCWLDGRPIVARPIPAPLHVWRWSKRNPKLIATAAVCLAVGAMGIWVVRGPGNVGPETSLPAKSIAVLPFENLNQESENRFFADGMQDDILTDLAKVADLKVISRSSVRQYKAGLPRNLQEIARTLGVRHVLEGSVRRADGRLRVNAQLIDTSSGAQIWAENYERALTQIFAIQSEIAQTIADQLSAKLLPSEKAAIEQRPTADLKAYDLYTEAKELMTAWIGSKDAKESIAKALALLDEATRRDPKFVLAYCQTVNAHVNVYFNFIDKTPQRLALAKEAADAAVRLAPDLAETHLALARYYFLGLRDFDAARKELTIALRALPNDADALGCAVGIDRRQGRWEDALAGLRKVSALDPRNIEGIRAVADTYRALRRYGELEEFLKRQITLVPESASLDYMKLAECFLSAGNLEATKSSLAKMPTDYDPNGFGTHYRYTAALYARDFAEAKKLIDVAPQKLPTSVVGTVLPSHSWFEGEIARAQRNPAAAEAAFAEARRSLVALSGDEPNDPLQLGLLAEIDAALNRKDDAIRKAKRAVELRPIVKDSQGGAWLKTGLAVVYAWSGERELALQELEELAKIPGGPSYGDLKFNPQWDDLREDHRFEKMVASLDPAKVAK